MKDSDCRVLLASIVTSAMFVFVIALWAGTNNMDIKLLPVPLDGAASVGGVRLFDREGVKLLVSSPEGLSVIDGGASKAHLVPAMELDSSGGWDARWTQGGFATVYTQPGSAVSWVMSRNSGAPVATRINDEAFANYSQPRFAKGLLVGLPITAIYNKNGLSQVVLFSRDPQTRESSTSKLGKPMAAIMDARLLRDSTGYWLFTLAHVPHSSNPSDVVTTVSGATNAAVLLAQRLDQELKLLGEVIRVFGDHPVHEFDVDAAPNGEVVIFATTPAGAIYGRGTLTGGPLPAKAWKETLFKFRLASPSLLLHDGSAYLAAVEKPGEPDTRVLRGQID